MANNSFGIDLGTSNIKIYSRADDSIMVEKNMIAIENKNTLFAYGDSAFDMYEKAPGNIHISYPLCNGVIADIKNMETLIKNFIGGLMKGNVKPSEFYIAVPTDITEVEKRAFYDLIKDAGVKAKKIMVVEKAIADGLGLDIDVKNSQGVLLVDVGYDTTEISILSLGGIVLSRLIKVGGLKFDDAIRAISAYRSSLGAYENRLNSTVGSLDVGEENITEAMSRIMDTDMATAMTEYTQYDVLTQAATSILAQANNRPQTVMSLLKG